MVHREHFSLLAVLSASSVTSVKYRNLMHKEEAHLPLTQHFLPCFCIHTPTKPAGFSGDGISQAYASTAN